MHSSNDDAVIVGLDFSTGSVKGLAFTTEGRVLAHEYLDTELFTANGVSELNLMQLEGQVYSIMRSLAARLREAGRLDHWAAIGVSATHHTAGRVDKHGNQIRRAICWNDQTLGEYHAKGLARLGGMARAVELIGGHWAARYTLSHLVKDEATLAPDHWERTRWLLPHGPLAAAYLTGQFGVISVSSAASTGLMDLRTRNWQPGMLAALDSPRFRQLSEQQLPRIVQGESPIGPVAEHVAVAAGLTTRPIVFPTNDDQQAGLLGGGAVEPGELAIILGNSAVINSSADQLPRSGTLDAMRLNWGPYLWMRCFNNGAQFLDKVLGPNPDWSILEREATMFPPGCNGVRVLPFAMPEPSIGLTTAYLRWLPTEPPQAGVRYRAALEALAYLVANGVNEHEAAGQAINRIILSGGIARSKLIGEILAAVLNRPIETIDVSEGPALGAATAALWGWRNHQRFGHAGPDDFTVRQAAAAMVRSRETILPNPEWVKSYRQGQRELELSIEQLASNST